MDIKTLPSTGRKKVDNHIRELVRYNPDIIYQFSGTVEMMVKELHNSYNRDQRKKKREAKKKK